MAELHIACKRMLYVTGILKASYIILEEDLQTIVRCLSSSLPSWFNAYPLKYNCWRMGVTLQAFEVKHIYRTANIAVDWMVIYVANLIESILWMVVLDILFLIFLIFYFSILMDEFILD